MRQGRRHQEFTGDVWHVWAELWVEALHDPELQGLNEWVHGEWREIMSSILRDGQDSGLFRLDDPILTTP